MIEIQHLTKQYGDHIAVSDLTASIEAGQIYGFLGPNGAGKSTTMNIITGCLAATSGTVTIDGYDIFEQPQEAKRRRGYLPEQPPVYPDMTPLEYLRVNGKLYILTEGGLKFKGIWWNGAISAAVYDSYTGMDSLAGLQMTGTAVYIDPLSDEYRSVIEARGVQLQQLQQMPAMLHAVRLDMTRYELLDGALRSEGYAARQVLDLG